LPDILPMRRKTGFQLVPRQREANEVAAVCNRHAQCNMEAQSTQSKTTEEE
jgi:hypothetical protein